MATEATPQHLLPALPDAPALERYRDAVEGLRHEADAGPVGERVERAREAMTGLGLGVPLDPTHYR